MLMTLLKSSIKNSETLQKEQVYAETMTGCDDKLPTANTEMLSDHDILTEFQQDDDELEEDDEALTD